MMTTFRDRAVDVLEASEFVNTELRTKTLSADEADLMACMKELEPPCATAAQKVHIGGRRQGRKPTVLSKLVEAWQRTVHSSADNLQKEVELEKLRGVVKQFSAEMGVSQPPECDKEPNSVIDDLVVAMCDGQLTCLFAPPTTR